MRFFLLSFLSVFLAGCEMFSVISSPAQERGISGFVSDNNLRASLNSSFLCSRIPGIEQVEFMIHRGRVLLMGLVSKAATKDKVLDLVHKLNGIKEVIDEIQVGHEELGDYANDAWIGHRLRSVLFFDPTILSQNYHVRVADRVIYILGTAQSEKEKEKVIRHAEDFAVRRVVPYITTVETSPSSGNKTVAPASLR
jgi:osmotically-inducible protein OsmY